MRLSAVFAVFAALPVFAYEGPSQEFPMWRGEESVVRLEDRFVSELDSLVTNDEVMVVLKAALPVPFRTSPYGSLLSSRYDHVTDPQTETCFCCEKPDGPVFLKLSVPENAKPGIHDLGPVHVRVIDRVLPQPKDWKYLLDLWQHPWAVSREFGVEPFTKGHYYAMGEVWKTLAWCGVKPITATIVDLPWNHQCYDAYHSMVRHVKRGDGSWSHDYRLFDEYIEFARGCGLGPRIDCYTMCTWGYVVRWEDEKGVVYRGEAEPGSELFKEYWGAFLPDFVRHLEAKGWLKDTYISMDERDPEDMKLISEFIRTKAPGLKIHTAGNRNPAEFKGIQLDSFSLSLDHFNTNFVTEAAARRQEGLVTTFYVCCTEARPNTFFTSDDDEAYWLGVFPALKGLDGFLRWAANSWPRDVMKDAAFGEWKAGDTFLVYPDGSPSTRLLCLRAGVVAAEKWRILSEAGLFEKERGELAAKWGDFDAAKAGKYHFTVCRHRIEELVNKD